MRYGRRMSWSPQALSSTVRYIMQPVHISLTAQGLGTTLSICIFDVTDWKNELHNAGRSAKSSGNHPMHSRQQLSAAHCQQSQDVQPVPLMLHALCNVSSS